MKKHRALVLFGLAIAFGCSAALLAQNLLDIDRTPIIQKVEVRPVVVAKMDLSISSTLNGQTLEVIEWPAEYLPPNVFHDVEALEGRALRRAIAAGEPIQAPLLIPEGELGGLASVIAEDHRAVSVKVDPIVGVAGFVQPGSHVDVLSTLRRFDWNNKQPYAKAIIQNVKVLAIDQKLEQIKTGEPELVSVVTLEVTPNQAEQLTFMVHEGKLQLALRNPRDLEIVKTRGAYVGGMLGGAPTARKAGVQVVKGTEVSSKTY